MTAPLNQKQIVSAAQEKNTMPSDHEPLSAFTQRFSLRSAMSYDRSQSSPPPCLTGQHALRPCIYIAFRCSRCGSVRQAITELPAQAVVACPECSQECSFHLLGSGLTSRNLPFHQVHIIEPTRWDSSVDGEANSS
jgi:DNA-directed RNA polymerase subunit RPC12/RpoP